MADYLHGQYGDIGSDYVFINLWASPRGQAWSYPAAYDLVQRLRAKAIQALRELDGAGKPVTFAAIASAAGISRSWLYTQPDIRDQVGKTAE